MTSVSRTFKASFCQRMLGDQDETQMGIVSMGTNHLLRGLVPLKLKMM